MDVADSHLALIPVEDAVRDVTVRLQYCDQRLGIADASRMSSGTQRVPAIADTTKGGRATADLPQVPSSVPDGVLCLPPVVLRMFFIRLNGSIRDVVDVELVGQFGSRHHLTVLVVVRRHNQVADAELPRGVAQRHHLTKPPDVGEHLVELPARHSVEHLVGCRHCRVEADTHKTHARSHGQEALSKQAVGDDAHLHVAGTDLEDVADDADDLGMCRRFATAHQLHCARAERVRFSERLQQCDSVDAHHLLALPRAEAAVEASLVARAVGEVHLNGLRCDHLVVSERRDLPLVEQELVGMKRICGSELHAGTLLSKRAQMRQPLHHDTTTVQHSKGYNLPI